MGNRGRPAHRVHPFSAAPGHQDDQPGYGFLRARHLSRRCALRRPAGQAPSIRSSDVCFPNSRLRLPVLAGSQFVRQAYAWRGTAGFGTHRVAGGGGVHAHPSLRFGVSQAPLFEAHDRVGDVLHRRDRCDQPLASLSPPSSASSWTTLHAFAWVLPDEGRQDRFSRRCVNRDSFPDRDVFHR